MTLGLLLRASCAAALCIPLDPRADELAFHPSDGTRLEKRFAVTAEFELGDVTATVAGQDFSGQVPDLSFSADLALEFVDLYVDVEGGRPLQLVREFGRSEANYRALDESGGEEDLFELDGARVRFTWDAQEQRYQIVQLGEDGEPVEPEDSGADGESEDAAEAEDLEPKLSVDMDLRTLLPEGAVEQGARWDVAGMQLLQALMPGIDLAVLQELDGMSSLAEDDEERELFAAIDAEFLPELAKLGRECKASCTYAGKREHDGRDVAVIAIELTGAGTLDLAWLARMAMIEEGVVDEDQYEIETATLGVRLSGKGELLWDAAAGHAASFEFLLEPELAFEFSMSMEVEGETMQFESKAELLGKCRWTLGLR